MTEENEIIQLYTSGVSSLEIAERFGCSHFKILQVLSRAGVSRRRGGWGKRDRAYLKLADLLRSEEGRGHLIALRESGMSIYDLSILAAVRKDTVRRWLDEEGVE